MQTSLQDRFNINAQLEHLQSKYVGTGHPDTNRFEWNLNIKRDTYASLIGHHAMVSYQAIAENESIARCKYNYKQALLLPCGLPPEAKEEEE
jgi:splicing factor 3B subunit 5